MDLFSDVHKDKFGSGGTAQDNAADSDSGASSSEDFVEMHASCELFSVSATLCFLDKKMCEKEKMLAEVCS